MLIIRNYVMIKLSQLLNYQIITIIAIITSPKAWVATVQQPQHAIPGVAQSSLPGPLSPAQPCAGAEPCKLRGRHP